MQLLHRAQLALRPTAQGGLCFLWNRLFHEYKITRSNPERRHRWSRTFFTLCQSLAEIWNRASIICQKAAIHFYFLLYSKELQQHCISTLRCNALCTVRGTIPCTVRGPVIFVSQKCFQQLMLYQRSRRRFLNFDTVWCLSQNSRLNVSSMTDVSMNTVQTGPSYSRGWLVTGPCYLYGLHAI